MVTFCFIRPMQLLVSAASCTACLSPVLRAQISLLITAQAASRHCGGFIPTFGCALISAMGHFGVSSVFNHVYESYVLLTLQSHHSGQGDFGCLLNSDFSAWR